VFTLDRGSLVSLRCGESEDPAVLEAAAACPMGAIAVFELDAARSAAS
jgi:ferredoxin